MQPLNRLIPPLETTQKYDKMGGKPLFITIILSGLSENFDRIMVTDNGTDNPENGYRLLSGYHSLEETIKKF